MTLILSGTDGLSDVDGSAATPAIRGTDANTGIFFPAADTIAFSEGGVESMRIDASGNMGLGVTPSASWGGGKAFVMTSGYVQAFTSTIFDIGSNAVYNGSSHLYAANGLSALYRQESGTHKWFNAVTGTAGNVISFVQAMTLDASGNLGIGTNSPTYKIQAEGATPAYFGVDSTQGTRFGYASALPTNTLNCFVGWIPDSVGTGGVNGDLALQPRTSAGANIRFFTGTTSASERARIDSSGRLMIGTTGSGGWSSNQKLAVQGSDTWISGAYQTGASGGAFLGRVDNTAAELAGWYYGASTKVGSITTNGTTTTYGTLSDHRLKENIAPMTGALEKVALLKPCTYKWKVNGSDGQGFIAHELQAVVPDCVVGEKDAVETYTDEDGNEQTRPKYQGIDTSFLVATLTAAIQEQQALITTLTDRITALEGSTPA